MNSFLDNSFGCGKMTEMEVFMSKRIPVYLSEEELEVLETALSRLTAYDEYSGKLEYDLLERLEAELATFEE